MSKFCFLSMASEHLVNCGDRCIMYNWDKGGCLIAKSLELYIKNNTPLTIKKPTEAELERLTELLKETLVKCPAEPVVFKHPELSVKHDYDECGVDWCSPGLNDIAP